MKTIKYYILAILGLFAAFSCNPDLPDELFRKTVLLNQNGFLEYDLPFLESSIQDTTIAVAVNGTSKLNRDVCAKLDVDADTLKGYNWDQFRNDESLYYELLPEECYEFTRDFITIKAGTEFTTVPIRFYLDKFDRSKNYVLPIRIVEATEYPIAERNYSTILMSLVLSNSYSGKYGMTGTLQEQGGDGALDVQMTRTLRALDYNTISLLASNTSEKSANREAMRMTMKVNADSTLTFTPTSPTLTLKPSAVNMDEKNPCNRYFVKTTTDAQNSHKKYVVTTFHVKYQYIDSSNPNNTVTANWTGTISRTKIIMTH